MIGFMVYCGGLVVGIVVASYIVDMIENLSCYKQITTDDLERLGEALKK